MAEAAIDDGSDQPACCFAIDLEVTAELGSKETTAMETDQGNPLGFPFGPAELGQVLLAAVKVDEAHDGSFS